MAKATGLVFSLFNIASAEHVLFGMPQYVHCILHGLTGISFMSNPYLLIVKGVDLVVAHDGFPL